MKQFETMGLPKPILARLDYLGIKEPTPIQSQAIPLALEGNDIMGLAQTGTGKTASFALPLIANLLKQEEILSSKEVRALILAPTRELANQISDAIRNMVKGTSLQVGFVVGGAAISPQIKRLSRGTDILVATPGRLIDLSKRRAINLNHCHFLVLDEADQMLDLGFIDALKLIATFLPKKRQTMLFSATMPKLMGELASEYLTNPRRIEASPPGQAAKRVKQSLHYVDSKEKPSLLIDLLAQHPDERSIVFGKTKHGAEKLARSLENQGFKVDAIHGNKSQGQRNRAIRALRNGKIKILVATDVAARGLDIPTVRYVYNYDLPNIAENYIHRIGRTARAGKDGTAISFCSKIEMRELKDIQNLLGKPIPTESGTPWQSKRKPSGKPNHKPRRPGSKPKSARQKSRAQKFHRARKKNKSKAKT